MSISEKLLHSRKLADHFVFISTIIILFVAWEMIVLIFRVPLYILPPPSTVFEKLIDNIDELLSHALFTAWEVGLGFLLAVFLAIPLALITAFSPFLRTTFYPAAVTLEMVPKIAFAPVIIIWFGLGMVTKFIIVFLVCFFPIIINGIFGFSSIPKEYQWFISTTGSSKIQSFLKIRLPAALPTLFVGIKGSAINAAIGATIAEWVGGDRGLGYFIQKSTGNFQTATSLAAIIFLTIIGLLLYGCVIMVEKSIIPWHESHRKERRDIE